MTVEQEIIAILKSRFSDTEFLIQLSPALRGFELRAAKGNRWVNIDSGWIMDKLHYFDPTVVDDIIDFGYWIVYGVDVSEAEIIEEYK